MSVWVRPRQAPDPEVAVFYFGDRAAENETGAVLQGRFELLEPIAWGGMAAVYKARNRHTKALCAVKVLYPRAREHVASLFGQEGRLATRIRSPHLIRANAFGEENGRSFIVFDYVQGEVLAGMYFMQLMPWRELLRVILQVLDALAALHRRGIVHRDVKPDNVIVEKKLGDEVHVTLLDLGCASVPPERRLTGAPVPAREVYGTAGFIAPELLAGLPPEPRNDLYSVGALMYLKLTTQAVPDISAAPEVMVIPPPRAFVPSIPVGVDDIVMRALSDVEARFQSAVEMASAIREVIAAEDRAAIRESIAAEDRATASASLSAVPREPDEAPSRPAAEDRTPSETAEVGDLSTASASGPLPGAPTTAGSVSNAAPPATVDTPAPRRSSGLAAALMLGAALGGGAVSLLAGPSTDGSTPAEGGFALDELAVPSGPSALPGGGNDHVPLAAVEAPSEAILPASLAARAPAITPAPTSPVPRRLASGKSKTAPSFEKAMRALDVKARECARSAGVAEEPLEVQVFGHGQAVSSVRVTHLGGRHAFTRCIESAIRAAAPPLGDEPIRQYTFFSGKR